MMDVGELVNAALVGFDRREPVTIPPLHDAAQWDVFEALEKPCFRACTSACRSALSDGLIRRREDRSAVK